MLKKIGAVDDGVFDWMEILDKQRRAKMARDASGRPEKRISTAPPSHYPPPGGPSPGYASGANFSRTAATSAGALGPSVSGTDRAIPLHRMSNAGAKYPSPLAQGGMSGDHRNPSNAHASNLDKRNSKVGGGSLSWSSLSRCETVTHPRHPPSPTHGMHTCPPAAPARAGEEGDQGKVVEAHLCVVSVE